MTDWIYDDGGRAQAGYRGEAGDCVTRAVAIAGGIPYGASTERRSPGGSESSEDPLRLRLTGREE